MVKKRKLSPSASSSHSSATPVPSLAQYSSTPTPGPSNTAVSGLYSASSPASESVSQDQSPSQGNAVTGNALPGPSRLSASATPAPSSSTDPTTQGPNSDVARAKAGVMVAGSGDGTRDGDECFSWEGFAMNKSGYRYTFCAPSPVEPPTKYLRFYRCIPGPPPSPPVHISWLDRSSFLRLSVNGLTATTDRGYRAARANVSVREGTWYYEVIVERGIGALGAGKGSAGESGNPHVRVGWGRREASLDAPVGSDGYSYGIRDAGGEKVHLSRPKAYGNGRDFRKGDVIGCLISLPTDRPPPPKDPADLSHIQRRRIPITFKGQRYFESTEYPVAKEMETLIDREGKLAAAKAAETAAAAIAAAEAATASAAGPAKKKATTKNLKKGKKEPEQQPTGSRARELPTLSGSRVEFFLNGEPLGTAFEDIYDFAPLPPVAPVALTGTKRQHDPLKDALHDDGTLGYYPMISCFGRGKVRCNFGPDWVKPPSAGTLPEGTRAMCDRWDEFRAEERAQDEKDEQEAGDRARLELAEEEARRGVLERKAAERASKSKKSAAARAAKKGTNTTGTNTPRTTGMGTPQPPDVASSPAPTVTGYDGGDTDAGMATPRKGGRGSTAAPSRSGSVSRSRAVSRGTSRNGSTPPADLRPSDQEQDRSRLHERMEVDAPADLDADGESEDEGVEFS